MGDERGTAAGEAAEAIYDRYVDACLAGDAPPPDELCDAHGLDDVMRERIRVLHEMMAGSAGARPGATTPFERLGDFRLVRPLEQGGMGTVYLAEQETLQRPVALKLLRPEQWTPAADERLRREALAAARLSHPGIVRVVATGEEQGVRYLAMDLVPGRTLQALAADAAEQGEVLAPRRVARWMATLADALAHAHDAGVIHRDVKPSNVIVTPDDRPMLLDFGISRSSFVEGATLTQGFTGSPLYTAPEIIGSPGLDLDGRADVYSLGATMYRCLTGRVPFEGESVEQLFHRVLTEAPLSPRRLRPDLPRDLEVIVLKCLERERDRRYADAAALRDDLRAFLEGQPVSAKPPGPVRRARAWCRTHPFRAAALVLLAAGLAGWQVHRDVAGRRALREARARIDEYRGRRAAREELERQVADLRRLRTAEYLPPESWDLLIAKEDEVRRVRRERTAIFHEALELLRRAEGYGLDAGAIDPLRAELFLEGFRDARANRDESAAAYYRGQVRRLDAAGRHAPDLEGRTRLTVRSDPPGAAVHLFRFEELPGEARLVAVERGVDEPPVRPGTRAHHVVAAAGDLRKGDVLLDVAEGRARLVRGGSIREVALPANVELRATGNPVVPHAPAGRTPFAATLPRAPVLILLRKEDFEDVRHLADLVLPEQNPPPIPLLREGTTPAGFVRFFDPQRPEEALWVMEREVTAAEYLAFVNDPEVRARIDAAGEPALFPRDAQNGASGGFWKREDGRFVLADDWRPDWPVLGVSWHDARAYAAWRTRTADDGCAYDLPTKRDWLLVGGAPWRYPYGDRFHAHWMNSCYSKPEVSPEPVLSYPFDESPLGVYDMGGSAREWLRGWADEERGVRRIAGGSWAHANPKLFELWGTGLRPDFVDGTTGFRLVRRLR